MKKRIKILIVDDSLVFRQTLARGIAQDPALVVVATASDPYSARDRIIDFEPDVMTLDLELPRMNGVEFLKRLMPQYPIPVVIVSSATSQVFDALDAGAVVIVIKPESKNSSIASFYNELIVKIKIASMARVDHWKSQRVPRVNYQLDGQVSNKIVAIGASTGGTEAILEVLSKFPCDAPGTLVVQHMPAGFTQMYAQRLNSLCAMEVKEASDGDRLYPGRVLIAPGDYHMRIRRTGSVYSVECRAGDKVCGHCPSVEVMFKSVAEQAGRNAIGVLLTGMGHDGAHGLLAMRRRGAHTIGQDEETSIVYGMPKTAYEIGAVERQLPLNKIPQQVFAWLTGSA
ncbi:MAG: protein-glutamate methylesterase/protein-glutamine glutaminase [Candidatus Saccharibacteria bacterium]